MAAPAPARLKARTEFTITLFVPAAAAPGDATVYRFEYKEAGHSWDEKKLVQHVDAPAGASEVLLDDLTPTNTYEVRIYAITKDAEGRETLSQPSEVAAVDTDVPGCTSEPKCAIL